MEQVPMATKVTVFPDSVQTELLLEVKLTVKPELAVALKLKAASVMVLADKAAKLMV